MDGSLIEKLRTEEIDELGEGGAMRGGEVLEFEFFDGGLSQINPTGCRIVTKTAGELAGSCGSPAGDLPKGLNPGEFGEAGGGGDAGGQAHADLVDVRGH